MFAYIRDLIQEAGLPSYLEETNWVILRINWSSLTVKGILLDFTYYFLLVR